MPREQKKAVPDKTDDPKNAVELDKLQAKPARLHRAAEQLGEAKRQKPKKA